MCFIPKECVLVGLSAWDDVWVDLDDEEWEDLDELSDEEDEYSSDEEDEYGDEYCANDTDDADDDLSSVLSSSDEDEEEENDSDLDVLTPADDWMRQIRENIANRIRYRNEEEWHHNDVMQFHELMLRREEEMETDSEAESFQYQTTDDEEKSDSGMDDEQMSYTPIPGELEWEVTGWGTDYVAPHVLIPLEEDLYYRFVDQADMNVDSEWRNEEWEENEEERHGGY